ncbi:hypothetical protein [uncultured Devosia sp.]|uniref:hypothetical protein n=1 Tax=uncultured Devosia sp. TaxID=211434 RepID=UPI0035CC3952
MLEDIKGKLAWGSKRGLGNYLTIEFGEPHLNIREPQSDIKSTIPSVVKLLRKRRVWLVGDYQLWIQDCDWEIIEGETVHGGVSPVDGINKALEFIDGQIVIDIINLVEAAEKKIVIEFDGGSKIHLSWRLDITSADTAFSLKEFRGKLTSILLSGIEKSMEHSV